MKIRPMGAEVFHTEGQTDMTTLIVAFRNFANAPKTPPVEISPTNPVLTCINNRLRTVISTLQCIWPGLRRWYGLDGSQFEHR